MSKQIKEKKAPKMKKDENKAIEEDQVHYEKRIGTKDEVYCGTAYKTSGGLTKENLTLNKAGKVVSMKKSELGKKLYDNFGKKDIKPPLKETKEEEVESSDDEDDK
jgi:hypothetical protein